MKKSKHTKISKFKVGKKIKVHDEKTPLGSIDEESMYVDDKTQKFLSPVKIKQKLSNT